MAEVRGPDWEGILQKEDCDAVNEALKAYENMGLVATDFGRAEKLLRCMFSAKRAGDGFVFVSYTSNLISSGIRESIRGVVEADLIDALVSSAGGVEEDIIKCLGPTIIGTFSFSGADLRDRGLNRVGNLLIPNDNYVKFEEFLHPVLSEISRAQLLSNYSATTAPCEIISFIAGKLKNFSADSASSVCHTCRSKGVPIFCPALTDGSIGDMIFFYNFANPGLVVDAVAERECLQKLMSSVALKKDKPVVSLICLGGGLPKHFLLKSVMEAAAAHSLRTQLLIVSTGAEQDGCASSTCLRDDIACELLLPDTEVVKLAVETTLVFPLLISRALQPDSVC